MIETRTPIRLISIPFAGGSFYTYRNLIPHLSDSIKMVAVDFPGRGGRFSEPLVTHADDLTEDVYRQVFEHFSEPYAVYGHSLGALIGFLMVRRIASAGMPLPLHLFVGGMKGPSRKRGTQTRHLLPDGEFIDMLKEFNGTPEELLANPEMLDLFLPVLRADFQINDTYTYQTAGKIDVPMTVFWGSKDKNVSEETVRAWQNETTGDFSMIRFEGDHFFLFDHFETIGRLISNTLADSQERLNKQQKLNIC